MIDSSTVFVSTLPDLSLRPFLLTESWSFTTEKRAKRSPRSTKPMAVEFMLALGAQMEHKSSLLVEIRPARSGMLRRARLWTSSSWAKISKISSTVVSGKIMIFFPFRSLERSIISTRTGRSCHKGGFIVFLSGKVAREINGHQKNINCLTYHSGLKAAITGDYDGNVCYWDALGGEAKCFTGKVENLWDSKCKLIW